MSCLGCHKRHQYACEAYEKLLKWERRFSELKKEMQEGQEERKFKNARNTELQQDNMELLDEVLSLTDQIALKNQKNRDLENDIEVLNQKLREVESKTTVQGAMYSLFRLPLKKKDFSS